MELLFLIVGENASLEPGTGFFPNDIPRTPDYSWLWESLRVVFATFLDSNKAEYTHASPRGCVPGLPDEASALAGCSRTDLLSLLVSSFADLSSIMMRHSTLRVHLRFWLSHPRQRRFLKILLSMKLREYGKLKMFAVGVLQYGESLSTFSPTILPPTLGKRPLHPQTTMVLFEGLLNLGSSSINVEYLDRLLETAIDDPLPDLITRLFECGASVRRLDESRPPFGPPMSRAAPLQYPSVAAQMLKHGARPDPGLMPAVKNYIEASKFGRDTSKAESLLYLLLSHKADPNRIIPQTEPLTIAEYAMSRCPAAGTILRNWVSDDYSCEVLRIYEKRDDTTLRNSHVATKETVLLATSCQLPVDLELMKSLLNNDAHTDLLSLLAHEACPSRANEGDASIGNVSSPGVVRRDSEMLQRLGKPIDWAFHFRNDEAARLLLVSGSSAPKPLLNLSTSSDTEMAEQPELIGRRIESHRPVDNMDLSMFDFRDFSASQKSSKFMQAIIPTLALRPDLVPLLRPCLLQWAFSEENLESLKSFLEDHFNLKDLVPIGDALGLGTPLLLALQHCSLNFVEQLWTAGAGFGYTEGEDSGSHELVRLCSWDILYCPEVIPKVSYLLRKGARVNSIHTFCNGSHLAIGPLQAALGIYAYGKEGSEELTDRFKMLKDTPELEELVMHLISLGADLDANNSSGPTPLQLAILAGNSNIIRSLVERGADVNQARFMDLPEEDYRAAWFSSPLAMVCEAEWSWGAIASSTLVDEITEELETQIQTDTANILIAHGADVNLAPDARDTALLQACRKGVFALVELFIAEEAIVNVRSSCDGLSPLEIICHCLHKTGVEIAMLLVNNGALLNDADILEDSVDSGMRNALILRDIATFKERFSYLVRSKHLAENVHRLTLRDIQSLIDSGVDLNYGPSEHRGAALHNVLIMGLFSHALLLVDNGADIHAMNGGVVPLHRAIEAGHYDLVRLLLNAGASTDMEGDAYECAIRIARTQSKTHVVDLLSEWTAHLGAQGASHLPDGVKTMEVLGAESLMNGS